MDRDTGQPEREKDHAEGHEVFVTKDETGITSLSEEPEAADPSVGGDDGAPDEEKDGGSDGEGG